MSLENICEPVSFHWVKNVAVKMINYEFEKRHKNFCFIHLTFFTSGILRISKPLAAGVNVTTR